MATTSAIHPELQRRARFLPRGVVGKRTVGVTNWLMRLGARRTIVAAVDYRLPPDHRFPVPLHDCHAALALLARERGAAPGSESIPSLAAPARCEDLKGLPPAWIGVGTCDLFHDEDVAYAVRLRDAGVDCDLEVVEGGFHGFDQVCAKATVSKAFVDAQVDALARAFAG